jgi:hypothetical protein
MRRFLPLAPILPPARGVDSIPAQLPPLHPQSNRFQLRNSNRCRKMRGGNTRRLSLAALPVGALARTALGVSGGVTHRKPTLPTDQAVLATRHLRGAAGSATLSGRYLFGLRRMPVADDLLSLAMDRRAAARSVFGGALSLAALGGVSSARAADKLNLDDPVDSVKAFTRLTASLDPAVETFTRYEGKAFAIDSKGASVPLYGIEGIGALRTLPHENGIIRFMMAECAIYTDLASGAVLTAWRNPLNEQTVEVWHQRNGPVNFEIDPHKASFGAFTRTGTAAPGFQLPWMFDGDEATYALDVIANRKNPMDPKIWKRESPGETLYSSEHSQYWTSRSALEDASLSSIDYRAALQSLKDWHPWMLLGDLRGKIFTRMTSRKVAGISALSPPVRDYAEKHLAAYLTAPKTWTGDYVTAYALYMKERTPAP